MRRLTEAMIDGFLWVREKLNALRPKVTGKGFLPHISF